MIVHRSFDADRVNQVINDPSVRPYIGLPEWGELDVTPLIEQPENWCLFGAHGGFILTWSAPHVHEVHTMILPEGRGAWAKQCARDAIRFVAAQGDRMIWTKIAPEHRNTAIYALMMGMRDTGSAVNTFGKPHKIYSMEITACQ